MVDSRLSSTVVKMSTDIVDHQMLGALHLRALRRLDFEHDPSVEHVAFQTSTVNALMEGAFEGDTTIAELLRHGNLGIGTIDRLDGEMVILDGEPFVIDANGVVRAITPETRTPFAVVCRFSPFITVDLDGPLPRSALVDRLDAASHRRSFAAFRVDGDFGDLRLRSVPAQTPPFSSLTDVARQQTEWLLPSATGTAVGFRFPDRVAGLEVPGHHLHFLSDDRMHGGHVLDLTLRSGRAAIDGGDELHVELPAEIGLGTPGQADRAGIHAAESSRRPT